MVTVCLDIGNAYTKWLLQRLAIEGRFPSTLAELSAAEWQRAVGNGKPRPGLVKVNSKFYAVGQAARRHVLKERPKGSARYTSEYYGVMLAYAFTQMFADDDHTVRLFASHAPQDVAFAGNLVAAAKRTWEVESTNGLQHFEVKDVVTYDEPVGGYAHYAFTKQGKERAGVDGKTALVIDIGGYTTDKTVIDPDGSVDMLTIGSTRTGTLQVFEQFERDLRDHNLQEFSGVDDLDMRRLETAIMTGQYPYGKRTIECAQEAFEAKQGLVNDVIAIIKAAGGAAQFDMILLTGGGSALVYGELCAAFDGIEFVLVDDNREMLGYATVYGGGKIATLMGKGDL